MNEGEGDLSTKANAVAHALLFADLLNRECRGAPGIRGSRLLMACALPHDGEALLVSAEVDAATLEQVDVFDGPSRRFSNHILVAQERRNGWCLHDGFGCWLLEVVRKGPPTRPSQERPNRLKTSSRYWHLIWLLRRRRAMRRVRRRGQ